MLLSQEQPNCLDFSVTLFPEDRVCPAHASLPGSWVGSNAVLPWSRGSLTAAQGSIRVLKQGPGFYTVREKMIRLSGL